MKMWFGRDTYDINIIKRVVESSIMTERKKEADYAMMKIGKQNRQSFHLIGLNPKNLGHLKNF